MQNNSHWCRLSEGDVSGVREVMNLTMKLKKKYPMWGWFSEQEQANRWTRKKVTKSTLKIDWLVWAWIVENVYESVNLSVCAFVMLFVFVSV